MNVEWSAVLGIGLISFVVTLMLFPFAGRAKYQQYRPATFVGGVLFMPLFISIAVTLQAGWSLTETALILPVLFVGFWGSAAWLIRTPTQGSFVRGLEVGSRLNFRPDLILPGGVMLVKGIILIGVGMLISFQDALRLPQWNWWGFVLAFFGIITIIPIRGVAKMLARRSRFLGNSPPWQGTIRWTLLVVGLAVLLYGFLSAFMGVVPFAADGLRPRAELAWLAVALVGGGAASLAVREIWKRSLLEGAETPLQRFSSNLWMLVSVWAYMYGFVVLFMGRIMSPQLGSNPGGVLLGGSLFGFGVVLILITRPIALRRELVGTINIMVGMLAALEKEARWQMMVGRIRTIASYPTNQCTWHVGAMFSALGSLPTIDRERVEATRDEVMMSLSSQERQALMVAMDQLQAA
ncbi:MAG: hypothetical protein BMS9Abin17_0188 [Acidimicrobiia bacterium]|nr:MAG: hypothetical protein BMS9Abin17_0188 [Acidimicrobiia bacterium]